MCGSKDNKSSILCPPPPPFVNPGSTTAPLIKACCSTGGSEESYIPCLKPGKVAHSALETVTEITAKSLMRRIQLRIVILRWKMMKL